jgi:hypothetical protein
VIGRFARIKFLPFLCLGLASIAVDARSADDLPRIVSTDLNEINSYVYQDIAILHQSGERLVIDAMLLPIDGAGETTTQEDALLRSDFTFVVPEERKSDRLCVDLASRTKSFRKVSLLKLVTPTNNVTARIDDAEGGDLVGDGVMIVAFPTRDASDNPVKACLLQDQWIYPAKPKGPSDDSTDMVLQLRVNTGGGNVKIGQMNAAGVLVGIQRACERDESSNGLYDRRCRIVLFRQAIGTAKIRLTITQRNNKPVKRDFNVAITESDR